MGLIIGGIKMVRFMIVVKVVIMGVCRFACLCAIYGVRVDDQILDEGVVFLVISYFVMWVFVWLGGMLFFLVFDTDLVIVGMVVFVILNNIGFGLVSVGFYVNFSEFHDFVKFVLFMFMILGWFEFYVLVVLFVLGFWRR